MPDKGVRAGFDTALRPASAPPPMRCDWSSASEEPHEASQRAYGSRPKDVLDGWPAGSQTEESRKESRTDVSVRPLRIDVMGADLLSEAVREMAVRRVLLALSRFGGDVRKVTVRLAQPANPLGGFDQRCRMRARLLASDDIRAEAINGRMEAAVARAAVRLAKRVGWALDGTAGDGFHAMHASLAPVNHQPTPPTAASARGRRRTRSGRTGAATTASRPMDKKKRRRL